DSVFFVEYGTALYNQALTYVQPDCFGETGSLILSDLGTSTFVWEDNNTSATGRTNLGAGTYTVTITSGTCTRILTTTIVAKEQILPNATSDNLLCNSDNTGRIALNVSGGTLPYTYAWSNNAGIAIIENLAAGEYSCTVTDRNSCTVSQSFTITQPDSLLVQTEVTNLSCWNSDDGAISVSVTGGTQPYSYLWNDGVTTADRTNLYAVTYGLMVTDANGCNVATFPTVWHPDPITFWVTNQTDITCFGANDGTISTGIRGGTRPYSYTWSDEATTANRTDLSAGYYRLTVTDANSCVATLSANVTEPEELVAVANVSPIICAGDVAQLSASATGGTGVYAQYFWFREGNTTSPVCVQPNYQNVAPGTYYLVAKDSHNCTDTIQVVVEDAEPHNFVVTVTDATCNGASNGAISITPDGGFTFAWSNGISNTNNANMLPAGNYSVTITDASDCTTVIDTIVAEPEMPLIGSFDDMVLCEGQSYTLNAGSYSSYQWSNDATSQTII
ncbi:MAG: SprB repeat-containing protein, partial [Bacteroidales bacterium]|nr:SprB repeat-containing protein [Bacteroidales bacterium]